MNGGMEGRMDGWMDGQLVMWTLRDSVIMGAAWKGEGPHRSMCWKNPTFTLIFASSSPCQHLHEAQCPSQRGVFQSCPSGSSKEQARPSCCANP